MTKKIEGMATIEEAADGNMKIVFAPGCFDSFEGTQEELDQLMAELQNMIANGSLFEKSRAVNLEDLLESDDPEDQQLAQRVLRSLDDETDPRNLQ
jgi:hypothetical protein